MLKQRTAFIVGAGASAEFDLPVGSKLQQQIGNLVNVQFEDFGFSVRRGDPQIAEIIRRVYASDSSAYVEAGRHIHDAAQLSHSIDNFLDSHHSNARLVELGKLGITRAIVTAEQRSTLFVNQSNIYNTIDFSKLIDTFVLMQEGVRAEHRAQFFENASFIIFNYDRCVEHFFCRALMGSYKISEAEAAAIVNRAEMIHPYGTIGPLPWQDRTGPKVAFGDKRFDLQSMAHNIRTYTEQLSDSDDISRIRGLVANAQTVCFLGFSYQPQNMDLLTPAKGSAARMILGTAYDMSDFDIRQISQGIKVRCETPIAASTPEVIVESLKCGPFMRKYDRAFR